MKKYISLFLVTMFCLATIPAQAFAADTHGSYLTRRLLVYSWADVKQHSFSDDKSGRLAPSSAAPTKQTYCDLASDEVSKGEVSLYADVMERMLLSDNFQVSILYDSEDAPSYVLGTNRNGYIILKRYTTVICECGEKNPYEESMDIKKYYGGALSYYIDARDYSDKTGTKIDYEYVDILKNAGSDNIKVVVFNEGTDENDVPTRFEICVIGDSYSYIRRRAFGYNDDNTCSAVACGIALNYIKHKLTSMLFRMLKLLSIIIKDEPRVQHM